MELDTLVLGAVIGQIVAYVLQTRRRVNAARVAVIRHNNDWQMHREFLYRRRLAAMHDVTRTAPGDEVAVRHVKDRFDDEADQLKLVLVRAAEDAMRGLGTVDRAWWKLSDLWDSTHDREEDLDWAARSVRGVFDDLDEPD